MDEVTSVIVVIGEIFARVRLFLCFEWSDWRYWTRLQGFGGEIGSWKLSYIFRYNEFYEPTTFKKNLNWVFIKFALAQTSLAHFISALVETSRIPTLVAVRSLPPELCGAKKATFHNIICTCHEFNTTPMSILKRRIQNIMNKPLDIGRTYLVDILCGLVESNAAGAYNSVSWPSS